MKSLPKLLLLCVMVFSFLQLVSPQQTYANGNTYYICSGDLSSSPDWWTTSDCSSGDGGQTPDTGDTGVVMGEVSSIGTFTVGAEGTIGTINISNSGTLTTAVSSIFHVQNSGTLNVSGILNLSSGTILIYGTLNIEYNGTFNFSNQALNITGSNTGNLNGNGVVNINGTVGQITVNSGSTINVSGYLSLGNGTISLTNGDLNVNTGGIFAVSTGGVLSMDNSSNMDINGLFFKWGITLYQLLSSLFCGVSFVFHGKMLVA